MSGKRATRNRSGATNPPDPPASSAASSHKSIEDDGGAGSAATSPASTTSAVKRQTRTNTKKPTDDLTESPTPTGEQEPRRSVRATKGQHTKAFEALENGPQPTKRKQGAVKKGKKAAEKEEEEEDEEIIRCVCGATTQDNDDPNEPWIACEKCGAWQHNVCMGMSIFDDELPKEYFCEECRPEDHTDLLAAIAKGEKIWLARRQRHEEENKKKKGKKGKGKRVSDPKDRTSPEPSPKTKPSPQPEVKKEEESVKGKRKSRDHSQGPQNKLLKVSETRAVPALPKYTPPADLAESIDALDATRKKHADGLRKSLDAALELALRAKLFTVPQGSTKKTITERHAIEIERAVHDSHATATAVANQLRTLMFNLKKNVDLAARVFNRAVTSPALAAMSSEEMATEELQRENAEIKARADKQATLVAEEGPRMRRTHKGEEMVEDENSSMVIEEAPSAIRRQSVRDAPETAKLVDGGQTVTTGPLRVDTQTKQSPRQGDFDINKVFSSVTPSAVQNRRPSGPVPTERVDDPEVDRMLQEDRDSPPYSPTENSDPDVIWQGHLTMTNLADIKTVAKFIGGADVTKVNGIAWDTLIPPILTVAGRIPEDKAIPYLCSMRYNNQVDLVITSLAPSNSSSPEVRRQFLGVVDYFTSKKRYGVVGERKFGNVRDTYLVPVPAGDGPAPEILQNIDGHHLPRNRTEPLLLMVFVVRDEKMPLEPTPSEQSQVTPTPSTQAPTPVPDRKQSIAAPTWSPATPQAAFPPAGYPQSHQSHTPIPPPVIPGQPAPSMPQRQPPAPAPASTQAPAPSPAPLPQDVNALRQAQAEGEQKARQVLGPLFNSPTVTFLLPHAARMKEGEWNAVKSCLERDPRARDDLRLLSNLLNEQGNNARQNSSSNPPTQAQNPTLQQPQHQVVPGSAGTPNTASHSTSVSAPQAPAAANPKI